MTATKNKMEVEIWSDVMCPYCYLGKRKFEMALSQFKGNANIDIIWKSYQLSPDMITAPDKSIHQYLAEHKGISVERAKGFNDQVTNSAKQVGLIYNFDKAIPANSFKAHRLSHLAKQHDLQNELEEKLFTAYFTDGLNIDDIPTLVQIGVELGMDEREVKTVLESDQYAEEVRKDIYEAHQVGVKGVPFFVFDNKYAVSGAQESAVFSEVLEKAYSAWQIVNPQ
jgi:predicted DsbA family dithiol-disulfide isomerase